ncbi:MAG: pilus assembly PilX N-terminal domain-containing protein [Desulfuromonadaceae bacterium]|nr:pilus assembly PilX N-terminal domain-containing protein [Desulfuromonadaceae bacterium]MDD2847854.1 pilus assembly PilX N-terminal domain-containing protein [Desulfuromonadaceae bacterium]MDD4129601.1 pilus assembly PilX N-terminal domain-containing protein [Desulfuromonadaceae bacterium]
MRCIPKNAGATPGTINASVQNERGIILIIVLVMLLMLSILGSTVLTSSMSDLRIAGNARNLQEAFFNADGSLEHTLVNSTILNGDAWTGFVYMALDANNNLVPTAATAVPGGTTALAQVNSAYLGEGKAPRGSGYDDSTLVSYYNVNIVGSGTNATEVAVDAGIVKFH